MPALPFRNVKDIYDQLHGAGAVSTSLPEWSNEMNNLSQTDLFNAGLTDNFIKDASVGIDRALEATGLPNLGGQFGAAVGGAVGNEEAGRRIGQGLPRMAVNFAPLMAAGLVTGGAAPLAYAAGLAGTGALSGAETYTQTGSAGAGLLSGLTNVAMPGVANLGESAVLRGLGAKYLSGPIADELGNVTGNVSRFFPTTGQHVAGFLGGQAAAAGLGEASSVGQALLSGEPYHSSPSEAALNLTLGQLPFAAMHLAGKVVGREASAPTFTDVDAMLKASQQRIDENQVRQAAAMKTPIESLPDLEQQPISPTLQAKLSATLAQIRGEKAAIIASGDGDAGRKLSDLDDQELSLIEQTQGQGVMGEQLTPEADRVGVAGTEHFSNPTTGYRIIKVADDIANRDAGFIPGDLVGYSTKGEKAPVVGEDGMTQFDVPVRYHTKGIKDNRVVADAARLVENPDLPLQPQSGLDKQREFSADLTDVKSKLDAVQPGDTEGLRQGIEAFNGVLQKHGYEPLNDSQIAEYQAKVQAKDAQAAVSGKVNDLMLRIAQKEQLMKEREESNKANKQKDVDALAEAIKDPQIKDMWLNFEQSGRGGKGLFEKALRQWVEGGRVGGVDALRTRILETKKQGGVKTPLVNKSETAAKSPDADTEHVRAMRQSVAETITDGEFDDADAQEFRSAFADGSLTSDPNLREFSQQDNVKRWTQESNEELARLGVHERMDLVPAPVARIPAGGGFIHDFVPYDEATNKLGKHTLPKTGVLAVSQFKNMGKEQGTLPDVAIELGRTLVPEAFTTEGGTEKVNVPVLMKGLREKGPVVEVKKLGEGTQTNDQKRMSQILHILDTNQEQTQVVDGKLVAKDNATEEVKQALEEARALKARGVSSVDYPSSRYSFLGPKSEQDMPGYVEGLVRVPRDETMTPERWEKENTGKSYMAAQNVRYTGPHFGSEDTNVLAFFRGYEETLPNGKKAFHVIEVQSDWGQSERKIKDQVDRGEDQEGYGFASDRSSPHFLLSVYEPLALKAAIDHARSVGADSIILSDGETAMMTEGHDKAAPKWLVPYQGKDVTFYDKSQAENFASENNSQIKLAPLTQSAGMRLHYDTTLPSAMAKLTGEKGERIEVGQHKSTIMDHDDVPNDNDLDVEGSPVFRNADGTPKSSISGRIYPLDKVVAKQDAQGGLTLTDPSWAPGDVPLQRWNQRTPFVPQTPEEQSRLAQLAPDSGGVGLVKELQRSTDPATKSLADTLAKNFPESLHRVFVNILQMSQEGYAQAMGNREATVNLSHGTLMSNDPVRREQVMMHELMHGLTLAELDNPTNKALLDELEAQRQRLIDNLPEKLRSKLNDLIDRNWIGDYANGKASMSDLSSSPEWQQVMYGLMNAKELVTQGFTDGSMQKYMNVLKGPGKKGFGVFLDWVKRLLRIPTAPDSEFSHFMDTTSAILKQGDYVSDVSNFFDRQFAQKGYAPGLVREQSRKALEVVQSMAVQPSKELLLHTLEQRDPITAEYRQAETAMDQMFADSGEKADAANAILGEMGAPKETLATLLTEHLSGNVSDMRDAMDMLPVEVTRYLFERARDMQDVLGAVRDAADAKNDGLVNLADPKSVRGVVGETLRSINNFLKIEQSHEEDRTRLARMQTVAPDAFFDSVLSEPSAVPGKSDKGLLEKVGDAIGAVGGRSFEHFLQQPAQIARSNPIFGEWYSKAILLNAQIRNMVKESMSIFGRSLSPEGVIKEQPQQVELDKAYKALQSPAMRTALDQLLYLKQERGGKAVGPIDYKDPAVVQILSKLSEADRGNLISIDNKIRLSKVAADQQTLRSMQQVFATLGARVVMRDTGMKMEPAVDAANKVFDAVAQGQTNPQVSQAILASVAPKMQPEPFLNLLRFTQDSVEQHQTYAKYLAQNSDWVSAQRNGSYIFEYLKGGKMVKASAENMADAKERSGGREILNWRPNTREDNDAVFLGANATDIITRMRELEQNQKDMLQLTPEETAAFDRTSAVAQLERETNATQRGQNLALKGRTLSKGAEELPWFENHIDWIQKNASYWQRRLLRTQGETMVQEPGTAGTATADLIRQHMSELLQRDPAIGRKIQALAFTWSIGFNPATIMANATQTYMRGVTELIRSGLGPIDALRHITQSWSDYIGNKFGGKPHRTPDEARFIAQALHDGQLSATIFDDNAAANEATSTNLKRVINKDRPQTVGQHVASAAGAYATAGSWLFRHGERANNEVMLLATFRALKKLNPEMAPADLQKQSYLTNAAANDVGGRANRSLGLYSGTGDFARTVAMTASSLQSYLLGSTFQLIRNLKAGLFRPTGLAPGEVYAARKAALYQLTAQFAAAGTLGMPFVSGALALLNQAFPELELNKKLRESVSSLLGGDTNNGHILSDMALSGIPSMFGWDFQSRLSAGNVLPGVSEYNGFQPEQLLGVPASLVTNWVNGAKKLASGDSQGGYAFVPPAIRGIVKLATGDATKDYRGRPMLQPTPGEDVGLALGFQPKRLSDLNAVDKMASQSQQLETRRVGQQNQQLAEEALKGNFGTVRASLQASLAGDKNYNPVDAVRAIARSAEEMTFPKDLRREGNQADMDSRKQLLSSFSIDPSSPSEVQRLAFRQGIEQRLGLTQRDPQEQVLAQTMDALRAQQPDATRAALRLTAEQTLRRTSPSRQALQSGLAGAAF